MLLSALKALFRPSIDIKANAKGKATVVNHGGGTCSFHVPAQRAPQQAFMQSTKWKKIQTDCDSPDPAVHGPARQQYQQLEDIQRFGLMPQSTKDRLLEKLGVAESTIEAFQAFVDDRNYDLDGAIWFAIAWTNAVRGGGLAVGDFGFGAEIDKWANNLLTVKDRITFLHSQVDRKTQRVDPRADVAAQPGGAVLNPASRKGWGASGASAAIQNAQRGTDFETRQKALYRKHVNAVGNAPVADAFAVQVPSADGAQQPKLIVSVAGENHKANDSLGFKVPRKPFGKPSREVPEKRLDTLDAAHRTFYSCVDYFNEAAKKAGRDPLKSVTVVPPGGTVYGYPADACAEPTVNNAVRFATKHPEMEVKILALNARPLTNALASRLQKVGVVAQETQPLPKDAVAV